MMNITTRIPQPGTRFNGFVVSVLTAAMLALAGVLTITQFVTI